MTSMRISLYVPHEFVVTTSESITITHIVSNKTWTVYPFKKNGRIHIRFSPQLLGRHRFFDGTVPRFFSAEPYRGKNKLFRYGHIRVSGKKLVHDTLHPFFWLGDTQWFAMTQRCSLSDFKSILKNRVAAGFTGIQTVVGIPPEVSQWSPNGANLGGFPLTKTHEINEHYFNEVDKKIAVIVAYGLVPCIFGSWGHHIDTLGVPTIKKLWREIIARYSAYPVLFSVTGEADLFPNPWYGEKAQTIKTLVPWTHLQRLQSAVQASIKRFVYFYEQKRLETRLKRWRTIGEYIAEIDAYHRPLTIHPHSMHSSRELFPTASWLTINGLQSGHSVDRLHFMQEKTKQETHYNMPFINLEPWYEGILGNFGEEYQMLALNSILDVDAAGISYGAQGLWNMAKKNDTFLGHWGTTSWQEALQFPGAARIGKIVSSLI
jgi:hypothetical protein